MVRSWSLYHARVLRRMQHEDQEMRFDDGLYAQQKKKDWVSQPDEDKREQAHFEDCIGLGHSLQSKTGEQIVKIKDDKQKYVGLHVVTYI